MDRNEARQEIKDRVSCETYLEKSKNGLYCCPLCDSGKGGNGTGAVKYYKDTNTWFCFACNNESLEGHRGDVIDLYAVENGLSHNDALQELARECGITIEPYRMTAAEAAAEFDRADKREKATGGAFGWNDVVNPSTETAPESAGAPQGLTTRQGGINPSAGKETAPDSLTEDAPTADYREYYKVCRKRLEDPAAVAYLLGRGIRLETAVKYWIGYDPAADVANAPGATGDAFKPYPCRRIIIPTTRAHYVGRSIDPTAQKAFEKMNPPRDKGAGSPGLFNIHGLKEDAQEIFIVEGAFDALSILQAGYVAIALNSAGNTGLFMDKVLEHGGKERYKNTAFICCPDNDPDPKTKERVAGKFSDLALGLGAVGRLSFVSDICERLGYKDVNDALQGNKDGLGKALKEEVAKARKLAPIREEQPAADPATDQGPQTAEDAAPIQEAADLLPIQDAEKSTLDKLKSLVDELRASDTFSERRSIEQEIIKAVTGDNGEETPTADPLPCLLTYSKAVEVFLTANDKYLEMRSFPAFSLTAKIKLHDSVVIAADTGAGKSSLAINFLNDLNEEYPCIYINLEMDTITVLRRLVAIQSGLEIDRIEGYKNDENTAAAVNTALQRITNRKPLQVIQGAYYLQTIQDIIEKSTTGRAEPTVVIIDHSLLVDTKDHTGSRYDRFTQVSEGLRRLSLNNNIIMFVLLQQNRAGKADNEKPQNSSLKESGSWENDATQICFLWYDSAVKKKKLLLTKNRNGSGGEFTLDYWKKTQTYKEAASAAPATPATGDGIPHKQTKREKQKERLLNAYTAAISATHGNPTLQAIAEAADVTTATVKGWIKEYGGYMVNGQTVDPAGIDATIEKDDFVKLTPADDMPFEDQEAAGATDQETETPWRTNTTKRL